MSAKKKAKAKSAKAPGKKKTTKKKATKKKATKKAPRKKAPAGGRRSDRTDSEERDAPPRPTRLPRWDHRAGRYRFPGISPAAYEHPADRAALSALRGVPGFDTAARWLFGAVGDRSLRLAFLGSAVRVGERQFTDLYDMHRDACRVLDISPEPELYVSQTPLVNAGAMGVGKPFLVLNSGSLGLLDEEELRFILGHELGHVLSGHVLYKTMLRLLLRLGLAATSIPLGFAALFAITTALLEWDRRSELSADRAGMLVVQDAEIAMRVHMKLAGGGQTEQMSVDGFLDQAEEYTAGGNVVDSVMKLLNLMGRTHPFPVLRLAELKKWLDDRHYDSLIEDGYPLRDHDDEASVLDDIRASGKTYKEDFEESRDPLARMLRNLGRQAAAAGSAIYERLRPDDVDEDEDENPDPDPDDA